MSVWDEQSKEQQAELRAVLTAPNTPPVIAAWARMVLLRGAGAALAATSLRNAACPLQLSTAGWPGSPSMVPPGSQAGHGPAPKFPKLSGSTPWSWLRPLHRSTGLTHWTTRALAHHLRQTNGITVSHNYIAVVLHEAGIELTPRPRVRTSRRPEPLDIEYEFVVVDGPHARALQQRQTEALLDILRWLRDYPTETE